MVKTISSGNPKLLLQFNEAKVGRSRALTVAEKKYLRQLNWLRFFDLCGFLLLLYSALALFVALFSLMTFIVDIEISSKWLYILLHLGVPLGCLWLLLAKTGAKLPKAKLWLSLANLEAVELTGTLGIQCFPEQPESAIWQLNETCFQLPEQWGSYLPIVYPDNTKREVITAWMVKREDATGETFKFRILSPNTETYAYGNAYKRISNIFHDFSYNTISIGPFSIEHDVQNRIPITRGNSTWLVLAIWLAVAALFLAIYCSILKEDNNKRVTELNQRVEASEKSLNLGRPINAEHFVKRDFPELQQDEEYGDQVLINDKPFAYVDVSLSANSKPFLLTQVEYKMISRVSSVTPQVLLDTKNPSAEVLNDYRDRISAVVNKSVDLPQSLRTRTTADLQAVNDAVLEQQIRRYGDDFKADLTFAKHFIPEPYLYLPKSRTGIHRQCFNRPLFCVPVKGATSTDVSSEGKVGEKVPTEDIVIINQHQGLNTPNPAYEVIEKWRLNELKQYKEARQNLQYIKPLSYWTHGFGSLSTAMFIIALVSLLSFLQAIRQIHKHYKEWPNLAEYHK